jgi:hypothetical protein
MAIASGANVGLSYVNEITNGVTPASPTMKSLRTITRNLNKTKGILRSAERRSDRMISDIRHGFEEGGGPITFQLSMSDLDDVLAMSTGGAWAAVTTGSSTLEVTSTQYKRAAGSFILDGFQVGDQVTGAGFTAPGNNVTSRITALTALLMTVDAPALVVEAPAAGRTVAIVGKKLKTGSIMGSMTVERRFTDIAQYQVFRGVTVNGLTMNITPQAIVGGTLQLIAMTPGLWSGSTLGAPTAPTTNSPFDSFNGDLFEGGVAIASVTGLAFTLANNRSLSPVLMKKNSPGIFEGQSMITGTLTAMFADAGMLTKFDNETESSVAIRFNDLNGVDFQRVILPRIKYTGGSFDPPADGPVTIPMPFEALVDSASGTNITWQRSNVT